MDLKIHQSEKKVQFTSSCGPNKTQNASSQLYVLAAFAYQAIELTKASRFNVHEDNTNLWSL